MGNGQALLETLNVPHFSDNLATDGESQFETNTSQNFGEKISKLQKAEKVDKFKHDNLKLATEKLDTVSLSNTDFKGHAKTKGKVDKVDKFKRDNLKLSTGKLEETSTTNSDFKV